MQDVEPRIPVELTASQIERRASISAEAANQLAIELHGVVADYRQLFAFVLLKTITPHPRRPTLSRQSCEPPSTSGLRQRCRGVIDWWTLKCCRFGGSGPKSAA